MRTQNARNRRLRSLAALPGSSANATAISRLPALLRWVMLLGGREGLSTNEIARLAGTSIEAVKSMQCRGLALIGRQRAIPCGGTS